jgi:FKBP-type peptidyl-prolyl cis-trans isomerase
MKKLILVASALGVCQYAQAQNATPAGFTHLASGIDYKIIKDVPGTKVPMGDYIMVHAVTKANDTVISNSRQMANNEPQAAQVSEPKFAGDPMEVINMLTAGDSVVIRVPGDVFRKANPGMPEHIKSLEFDIQVASVKTKAQFDNEQKAAQAKMMEEQAKQQAEADKKAEGQKIIDDKLISEYLAANKIKATKTASGLYYKIDAPGTGEQIKAGQTLDVMYEGKLLNGKVFDANMGPQAKRNTPISFAVGTGRVIKGWDEGLLLLKKGSKATFYIPSPLAYGPQSMGNDIPANSVLVFDVEVKEVK